MKKYVAMAICLMLLAGCSKENPVGPKGDTGDTGPTGPAGPGYAEMVLQPGPDDATGKDNFIGSKASNLGMATNLGFGYSTSGVNAYRALIYFNVASGTPLATTNTVVEAILTLYPEGGTTAGNLLTAEIYPLTRDWTESGSTWTAATGTTSWTTPGGDYVTDAKLGQFTVDPTSTTRIDVYLDPSYVQNWINGHVNYGMVIKSTSESGADSNISVFSRNYSVDSSKRPALKIIYK